MTITGFRRWLFPDNTTPVINNLLPSQISVNSLTTIDLKTVISDTDNLSAAIVKTVKSNSNTNAVSAVINDSEELVLTPHSNGNAEIVVSFNSNGKVVDKVLSITSSTSVLATAEVKKIRIQYLP
ncbi:hypothetical protein ACFOEQ_19760 [Chryseobacterium arachidis]|uniref:hypothetical protein n=1 Tax=Chryseobacterium arachidis TaxID=1416778 RepID=UPI00360B4E79